MNNTETLQEHTKAGFIVYMKSKGFTSKSIESRLNTFKAYCRWLLKENLEIEQVTYNELLAFMKWCKRREVTQRTIQNYIGTIKHLYEHLIREGQASKNPAVDIEVKGIKRQSLYHILEPVELQALYNNFKTDNCKEVRDKVILGLLINQGLKTMELGKLEVKDIKLREGRITVPGSKRSNGRIMQLQSHQVMEMYDYVLKARAEIKALPTKRKGQQVVESDKLFIGDGGYVSDFSNYMSRLMAKIRKLNPSVINAKQIRASVITKWLKVYNLREVQYLAGHRYISSTESYLENEMEGLKEEVQQFHPLG
jgi:integrase/recombinase XerD